jgi:hypothetical protein
MYFQTRGGGTLSNRLTINETGAATFASSVSATDGLFDDSVTVGNTSIKLSAEGSGSKTWIGSNRLRYNEATNTFARSFTSEKGAMMVLNEVGDVNFYSQTSTSQAGTYSLNPNFTLLGTGEATFASSVTAKGNILTQNPSDTSDQFYMGWDGDEPMLRMGGSALNATFKIQGGIDRMTLTSTGAATFASSVTASSSFISTVPQDANYYTNMRTVYSYNESFVLEHKGTKLMTFSDQVSRGMIFNSANGVFQFNGGAATFASSVNATDVLVGKTVYDDTVTGALIRSIGLISASRDGNVSGIFNRNSTTGSLILFRQAGTQVGSIYVSGSATAYNTNSDYRLKEDLKDFNGLEMISNIPVYNYKWKVDESRSYGVMAHELQEVLPDAVSGEKDAEEMQGVDYSKIVPLLIKSIQELKAEIELLKIK